MAGEQGVGMPLKTAHYTDTQRMSLRSQVLLASEAVAPYWPMRTFIHHNPLHELETLRFQEAVEEGARVLGGRGYLPNEQYRRFFQEGRIRPADVDAVLRPLARDASVQIGGRTVSHLDVLRVHLLHGIGAPGAENLEALVEQDPEREVLLDVMRILDARYAGPGSDDLVRIAVGEDIAALGRTRNLASWCDGTLGTTLAGEINDDMTRWCAAFLDEGQATWAMPLRERSFYGAWKSLARNDLNRLLRRHRPWMRQAEDLPDLPEDAILEVLTDLRFPENLWSAYFTIHLAALPGWSAFIKWRADQQNSAWERAYPISLVKYLAVRLFHERAAVGQVCREELDIEGTFDAVRNYMEAYPLAYYLRRERVAGRLPVHWARQVDRLRDRWSVAERQSWDVHQAWDDLARRCMAGTADLDRRALVQSEAWRLVTLSRALGMAPSSLAASPIERLTALLNWLDGFPESHHGPYWLKALEAGYQAQLLSQVAVNARALRTQGQDDAPAPKAAPDMRPQAQAVFCIDVRSEPFRRHLETVGSYETYGFAGFFICFIRYLAFGSHHETDQFPVIMKARNHVREVPRSYHGEILPRHRVGAQLLRAAQTLVHDLKENVVTAYVMVETLGWFYHLPFIGKTLFPAWYRKLGGWFNRLVAPPVSTTLTVDKLSKDEANEMVASEQRAAVRQALLERLGLHGSPVSQDLVEALRLQALNGDETTSPLMNGTLRLADLSTDEIAAFVGDLRRQYGLEQRWVSVQKERITRVGFTLEEQVFTVETALRMMGLTRNFARLVLFCAHGSTSDNNPFESALDCGACGGNEGTPNARVLAAMANKQVVRDRLAKNGLEIPPDTHFLAGQVDTTTDKVQLFDLEDAPPTHRKDLVQLLEDLRVAGRLTSQWRLAKLPDVAAVLPPSEASTKAFHRSSDWSQVRPEWGLSGNAAFLITRRDVLKSVDLDGRAFLHSYDYREDPSSRLLEILLTAPQVVTQWINMEHYFSTVDNDVYGAGSKIYHNVVGRLGVMSGTQSDLRIGLAWQTVMTGDTPYHEPVRLLTLVEAPRARLDKLIHQHEVLKRFYHNEWVHLIALEREEGVLYRYLPTGAWTQIDCDH